jgi:PAS domain S-box-containing protein
VRTIGRLHRERRQIKERAVVDQAGNIEPSVWNAQPLGRLMIHDATTRRWADAGARRSQQRFYDSFRHSPDAVFVVTHDGIVRDVNPSACRLYGLPPERLLGRQVVDLAPPSRQARAAQLLATLEPDTIDRFEGVSATADGRSVPVEIHISPTEYAGAPAWMLHVRDISRYKQLEGQLLQSQQLESVGRLASGVAHDFNNLLTVISGYANLALDQLSPSDPLYGDLREIQIVVERATRLIRQLLAFARQQVIEPQLLNLNDLILELRTLLRHLIGEGIDLAINPATEPALVRADPSQIERLLVNLAVNARDAMPAGGKLIIDVRIITCDDASLRLHVGAGGAVRLSVTDTGVGMDELVKRRLFEHFYTTKALGHGTGLGLATCYGIVKQHGGHIEVESEVQQGTTFTIYLPAASCPEN